MPIADDSASGEHGARLTARGGSGTFKDHVISLVPVSGSMRVMPQRDSIEPGRADDTWAYLRNIRIQRY